MQLILRALFFFIPHWFKSQDFLYSRTREKLIQINKIHRYKVKLNPQFYFFREQLRKACFLYCAVSKNCILFLCTHTFTHNYDTLTIMI